MTSNYFLQKTVSQTFEQADAEWKDVRLISPFTREYLVLEKASLFDFRNSITSLRIC